MPSLGWYLRRLRTMSAAELAWRARGRIQDAELWVRVALGREPTAPRDPCTAADAFTAPPFRVCDVGLGEWAAPRLDQEKAWRDGLVAEADRVARHRLGFFDLQDVHLGDPIDWNRDHGRGQAVPLSFAPLLDYRDPRVAGDAKVVWEPNRHHHLVVLGRAYRATGEARYAVAVVEQLESWLAQCPFGRGMNWRSPLELAIRLINWVWAIDLVFESGLVSGAFRERLREAVYRHLWEITRKYSRGSSANNHRIGEAAGVFIATSYFAELDQAGRWRRESRRILSEEITVQTHADGGTREQATGYHLFVLDFFLIAGIAARKTGEPFAEAYWSRLERMVHFLGALSAGGATPMIGDADDGYVLDLGDRHDVRTRLGIGAVLFRRPDFGAWAGGYPEAARWLLGASSRDEFGALATSPADDRLVSCAFPESGYYLLQYGRPAGERVSVVFDCGELGFRSIAAHGHADALSFVLRIDGEDVFVDPGTYDYFSFPAWREYFRSTRAHNTVAVDGLDQSVMLGPFLWGARANARCLAWEPATGGGRAVAEHDGYMRLADPVRHVRTLELDGRSRVLTIQDEIEARGTHDLAAYFHLAEDTVVRESAPSRYRITARTGRATLALDPRFAVELLRASDSPPGGWVSRGYHRKAPGTTLVARARCHGHNSYITRIEIGERS